MRKDNVIEDFHGTLVADPYRWLEDQEAVATREFVEQHNSRTRKVLDTAERDKIRQRLIQLWDFPKWHLPQKAGNRLFYQYNDGLRNQPLLYMREGADGEPKEVLDSNTFSDDGTVALTNFGVSRDGRLVAYATSSGGSDWQNIRILNVDSGREYPETLEWCRFTNFAWTADGKGFYYSRFPHPDTVAPEDRNNFNQVFFHRVGTGQQEDKLIYHRPDAKELGFTPYVTEDGQYLCLLVYHGTATRNRFYYRPLASEGEFVRLLDRQDAAYRPVGNVGSRFFFHTDLDAPRGRIIAIDLDKPDREDWLELVPEGEDVIDAASLVGGRLVVSYMHHARHVLQIYDSQGNDQGSILLPDMGTVLGLSGKEADPELYIAYTSFLCPTTVYCYDLEAGRLERLGEPKLSFDPDQFETRQVFYASKDGTQVPMFVACKKGLDLNGSNPALLYGYGGFNISMTPTFSPANIALLEQGVVYAVACIRGGGEYGEKWHQAGMLHNKQNVFDDFMAAGQWLVDNGYTDRKKLAIMGGSNGGLLVAACMVQRPDLIGAVVCRVPVIDMLRYHKFTVGRYWIPEYGNAEANAEHFRFLYAYSPLHNVRNGCDYPPVLIMTADTDDRVVPGHALKFAATLLEAAPEEKVLLRLETRAGHGFGKPTGKLIDEAADIHTFLYQTWSG